MKILHLLVPFITSLLFVSCSKGQESSPPKIPIETEDSTTFTDFTTFTFSSNGTPTNGKIYLPDSYETNANLPAIYLIDYKEQHFEVATDEFEKVVDAVRAIAGFDALVVTLKEHLNTDTSPGHFYDQYDLFKNMTAYVDSNYTTNTTRTFIGRGSEAGLVLMALFSENSEDSLFDNFIATDSPDDFNSTIVQLIEEDDFPQNIRDKRLHFSFSSSNDYNSCTQMINRINGAQFSWLQFESVEYNTSYPTTYPTAFSAGLRYVFDN